MLGELLISGKGNLLKGTVADLPNHLFRSIQSRNMCLLIGAGISKNSPSNMPLANDLQLGIMRELLGNGLLKVSIKRKLSNYPFEAFLQVLSGDSDILESIVRIFRQGKPNKNHVLIAKLMNRGFVKNVLTTNFDVLLEKALENEGMKRNVHFRTFFTEKQFSSLDFRSIKIPAIFKIHGSAEDINSIRATLELVATESLSKCRARILNHFFSETKITILVMGYSAKDEFDINPVLRSMKCEKEIIFVKHDKKEKASSELKDPFEGFKGIQVKCDTDNLTDYLWKMLIRTKWKDEEVSPTWKKHILEWGGNLSLGLKHFSLAKIFREIGEISQAKILLKRGLRAFQRYKDKRGISLTLHNLAVVDHEQGNYDSAMKLCEESLGIKKELDDLPGMAATFHQQAIIKQDQCRFEEAIQLYDKSLKIKRMLNDQVGMAATLNNLAAIYERQGNYRKAVSFYQRSLDIENKLGDLRGAATALHNLAVARQNMGEFNLALRFYKKSLEMRKKLFDQSGIASSLHQLATIYQLQGNQDKAEKLYEQSLKIRTRLKDQAGMAESFHQLATILYERKELDQAIELYKRSLEIEMKLHNKTGIARTLHNIAMIHQDRGNQDRAIKLYNKCARIFIDLGDRQGTAETLHEMGFIHRTRGNLNEALKLYSESLKMFQEINDKFGITGTYGELGRVWEQQGKSRKAIRYYRMALKIFEEIGHKLNIEMAKTDIERANKKLSDERGLNRIS